MFNIFKYIGYAFKAKKGINHTDEFVADVSFGPLEGLFIVSFILLGIVTLGLGFLAFYFTSKALLIFALLFLAVLSLDIWVFLKVKKFFQKMSEKAVTFSKEKYKTFNSERVVDVDYE